jgi:hypothetical protein
MILGPEIQKVVKKGRIVFVIEMLLTLLFSFFFLGMTEIQKVVSRGGIFVVGMLLMFLYPFFFQKRLLDLKFRRW